ncbi:MAG: sugar-binding protein, partial [Planctomycetota bacterium]
MIRTAALCVALFALSLPVQAQSGDVATDAPDEFAVVQGTPGFWRLARTHDGTWWFLSPDGDKEFLNTVTTVVPYQQGRRALGPHYVSRDWHGQITGSLTEGDVPGWGVRTHDRVIEAGFKGFGAWCHPVFHDPDVNSDTPITRDLNLWLWTHAGGKTRLYDADFAAVIEDAVEKQVSHLRDSTTLVGYFTDNELTWRDDRVGPAYYFDHLDPGDPNRQAVIDTIRQLWPTVEAFNADWQTSIASFDELDGWTTLPHPDPAYGTLSSAFIERVARDYFELTTRLVKKYDPNHLILGVRFKGYGPPEVVRAQKGLTDAVSINYYVEDARLDRELFVGLHEQSGGQPVMVTEYSFHALDGRSGNRNTFGFAAQVPDQQARADGYELMTKHLAAVPFIVGADWFQWNDEPPSGRTLDGEDVNFGVVDVDDHEYEILVEAVRRTTPQLNDIHAAGDATPYAQGAWRPEFSTESLVGSIPYLTTLPRIDGSLREWSDEHRVAGVRLSETIGADRMNLSTPTVFAGWHEKGLYVAVEVTDRQIQAAPPTGPWWTQDAVELFVSTSAETEGRPARGFTPSDHQFF